MRSTNLLESVLHEAFVDSNTKNTCIKTSLSKISSNTTNRAFDDFPPLLPENVLSDLTAQFQDILLNIKRVQATDHGFILMDKKDKRDLIRLEKKIIDFGCRDLLKPDGSINDNICKLLNWTSLKDKIDNVDLLCAYTAAVNLSMMNLSNKAIHDHSQNYNAICDYLNRYYRTWVIETLRLLNIPYKKYNDAILKTDESLDSKLTNGEIAAISIGATITGLTILGLALFKATHGSGYDPFETLQLDKPSPQSPPSSPK